jgi:hypothetical protein
MEVTVGWQEMKQFESEWMEHRSNRLVDMGSLLRGVTVHEIERQERTRLHDYAGEQLKRARATQDEAGIKAWSRLIDTWCSNWEDQ